MSSSAFHSQILANDPPERHRKYGKAALDGLDKLFRVLPLGGVLDQTRTLVELVPQTDITSQEASQAWFELVSAHALDLHADAGKEGTRWDLACIDALETWKLLRGQCNKDSDSWSLEGVGVDVSVVNTLPDLDVHAMNFGKKSKAKPVVISDWGRAISRKGRTRAALEAHRLAREWPQSDLPSIAMALGALWALTVAGEVVGVSTLEVGGVAGVDQILVAKWA